MAMLALWLQATPDVRSVSWWLPHGGLRDIIWFAVLSLNLAVLLWILYKLLFAGAGWSIPKALRGRGEGIQTRMGEAERAHQGAEARLAEIEGRIANLPAELAALAREGEAEAGREYQRLSEESQREAERIIRLGRQEIESAAKLAQKELHGLAAKLALELAGQRIKDRLTPAQDEAVVRAGLEAMAAERPN
ncbi:MAG: ATP synthase F0 subunit B [Terriglobales bacterium]